MHKEFQILKVNDVIEYKLSKLIHSLLKGTPGYLKSFINLLFQQTLSTPATQDINIRSTAKERKSQSENVNSNVSLHKRGTITQNI